MFNRDRHATVIRIRSMKGRWFIALSIVGTLIFNSQTIVARSAEREEIDAQLNAIAAQGHQESQAPGLSVAVVIDDSLAWSRGYGMADLENQVSAAPDTVYRIASISKPISAVAVWQLIERGRVSLEDPIQKYVPSMPVKPEGTVTVRTLLTNTSGIRHYKPGEFLNRRHFGTLEAAIGIFKDDPLLFPPGSRFSYTTYGFNLLAGVVETATGQSFGDYLHEHVFVPAGMQSSGLELQGPLVSKRARPYVRAGSGDGMANAPYVDLSIKWAGGGVISTVEDLCRFHIALNSGKLLKTDSVEQMQQPTRLPDGELSTYGMGWQVRTDHEGRKWVSHSGGTTGGTSFLLRYPAGRLAVAIIANVEDAVKLQPLARRLADQVLETSPAAAGN